MGYNGQRRKWCDGLNSRAWNTKSNDGQVRICVEIKNRLRQRTCPRIVRTGHYWKRIHGHVAKHAGGANPAVVGKAASVVKSKAKCIWGAEDRSAPCPAGR